MGKSGVLERKSGNSSETRKDVGKFRFDLRQLALYKYFIDIDIDIDKSYYGGPIGTHQRSLERYEPIPPIRLPLPQEEVGVRNPHPKLQSLLSQERVNR